MPAPLAEAFCVCSTQAKTLACLICEAGDTLVDNEVNLNDREAVVACIDDFATASLRDGTTPNGLAGPFTEARTMSALAT